MRNVLFSCIFLTFNCLILLVFGRCPEDQQSLLLELKNNLTYNSLSSQKLVQWNESVDYCNWNGVSCDHDGCVVGLDLSNEMISGGIDKSSSLFRLRFLRDLNLAQNMFDSTMPFGFQRLSNLSVLNISDSGFSGQIPIGISALTRLFTLDLTSSSLLSRLKLVNPNLTTLVQNLSNLRVLVLDGVDLSAEGREWCKALSSSRLNLRVLSLSSCSLSGPLDSSLVKLRYLSEIRLDKNNFSSSVPEEFAEFSGLTSLHLSDSELFGVFPQSILQVSTLKTLDLSINELLQGSLPDFQSNGPLQTLVLSKTNFSGRLPDSIGYLENLTILDLGYCNFVGPIPSFSLLKNLTVLNLAQNQFYGSMFSTKWEELSNLVDLDLCNNSLTGNVPLSLFHLPSIQKIQLCYNQFNGSLNELSNVSSFLLDTLDLEGNQLGGPFPMPFSELRGLETLSLSFNNFTGKVNLNKFMQLKNMSKLELSSNSLSVEIDDKELSTLSDFPYFSILNLASCKLKRIPEFLKNQSELNSLDLSHNELEGEIPLWIWNFDDLIVLNLSYNSLVGFEGSPQNLSSTRPLYLDLHSNKFKGPLIIFPQSALYLDFSDNNFDSVIPPDVGAYLQDTSFFSLSRNYIQGSIPESICNASSLQVLDLSHNNLSGLFPQCLTDMTMNEESQSLVVLNLRGNALNGSIPNTFPVACSLRTLDLSGNNIEGQVPSSLSNCRDLEVLNLRNNQIRDTFPCPLRNISTLRVLVLRSNQFHGKIGCPESNGTWLSLQIIDLSQNNFSGDIPGNVLIEWKAMVDEKTYSTFGIDHLHFTTSDVNYQDTVTVTIKGSEMELTKILTVFTSIDFSQNHFNGHIPADIGELRALYLLNLSHNSLSSEIPSSIGNLRLLGSLDLSRNFLSGEIPSQLARLTFLSVLNLSYNRLVGMIPIGSQFQTFPINSFVGNEGLCGAPLPKECATAIRPSSTDTDTRISEEVSGNGFEWKEIFIFIASGFVAGAVTGVIFGLRVWEKQSDTLMSWFSFLVFNDKKRKRKRNSRR